MICLQKFTTMPTENHIYVHLIWSPFFLWLGWWSATKLIIKLAFFLTNKSLSASLQKRLKTIKRNLLFDTEYIIREGMLEFGFAPLWHIFWVICPCHAGASQPVDIANITNVTDSGETEPVCLRGHDGRTRDPRVVGLGGGSPRGGQNRRSTGLWRI